MSVMEDDTILTQKDFYAKLDRSIKQAQEGKVIRQKEDESTEEFISRMLCTE